MGRQGEADDRVAHVVPTTLGDLEVAARPLRQPDSHEHALARGESAGFHLGGGALEPHQHVL
eukprot:15008256-Alexandrium_andersonii.AAC.1